MHVIGCNDNQWPTPPPISISSSPNLPPSPLPIFLPPLSQSWLSGISGMEQWNGILELVFVSHGYFPALQIFLKDVV